MSKSEHEDPANDLEVEITDLDPSYENGKFVDAWLHIQRHLSRISWKPTRSMSSRFLLLMLVFFVPLFIGTSYGPERATTTQYSSKSHCVIRSSEVVISDGTVTVTTSTTLHVTIVVITQTVHSSSNSRSTGNSRVGSVQWSSCK